MQPDLAERVRRIAVEAREAREPSIVPTSEWWTVTRADGSQFEVFMCPPATNAEMLARYPSCGVLPVAQ